MRRMIVDGGPAESAGGDAKLRSKERPVLLLVDDLPENLFALEQVLRRDDVDIVTAHSGQEALEQLLARDVALAIIDVQMPVMDGFELAALMRGVERTRRVPIIFVTAGSSDRQRVFRGYEAGAVDFLFKPLDVQVLCGKVDVFITLERQRKALEASERMHELFVAILGHDLRNPLGSALMGAQIARSRTEDDAIRRPLQLVLDSGARMLRMIDQLLDMTRIRSGSLPLSTAEADLCELLDQAILGATVPRERFRVEAIGDTTGWWDPDRLFQVCSNLVGNACDHAPDGTPIHVRIDGASSDAAELRIQNGGAPIPDSLRDVLFEPYRSAAGRNKRARGLGLGLYITREFVAAHGGTIRAESSEEDGTTFVVRLPRGR